MTDLYIFNMGKPQILILRLSGYIFIFIKFNEKNRERNVTSHMCLFTLTFKLTEIINSVTRAMFKKPNTKIKVLVTVLVPSHKVILVVGFEGIYT